MSEKGTLINRTPTTRKFGEGTLPPEITPAPGPFSIIERAFTHISVSDINLESLETLGDAVLNEAVVMIIVTNWPNLTKEKGQVANMKKYHTSNENIAVYAQTLGLLPWIVRDKDIRLKEKERADVFESFIGALTMIGEFYIGDQMGLAIARLFLNKFFSEQEWHPGNPQFYEAPQNLYNDWKTSTPDAFRIKEFKNKYRNLQDKQWIYTFIVKDTKDEKGTDGPIYRKTGKRKIELMGIADNKDDAERKVFKELALILNIKRGEINIQRRKKQEANPEINKLMTELEKLGKERGEEVYVPAKDFRGERFFIYIKAKRKEKLGKRILHYDETVASGSGATEVEALSNAVLKYSSKNLFKSILGTDVGLFDDQEITDAIRVSSFTVPLPQTSKSDVTIVKVEVTSLTENVFTKGPKEMKETREGQEFRKISGHKPRKPGKFSKDVKDSGKSQTPPKPKTRSSNAYENM